MDLSQLDDEQIAQINNIMLYRFLLALKGAKDAIFLEQHTEELVIFASNSTQPELVRKLYWVCVAYLIDTSSKFHQKLKTMGTPEATLPEIKKLKKSRNLLLQLAAQNLEKGVQLGIAQGVEEGEKVGLKKGEEIGVEKGMKKAILAFLKKSPKTTDEEAAELFEVSTNDIKNLRNEIQP